MNRKDACGCVGVTVVACSAVQYSICIKLFCRWPLSVCLSVYLSVCLDERNELYINISVSCARIRIFFCPYYCTKNESATRPFCFYIFSFSFPFVSLSLSFEIYFKLQLLNYSTVSYPYVGSKRHYRTVIYIYINDDY